MLLPIEKEREFRFKLALRLGLPIFALASILIFSLLSQYLDHIPGAFIIIAVGLLAILVYFAFYIFYQGYNERITDPITRMFTREYLFEYFEKEIKHGPYTIIMVSIDNLNDINERYGVKNGDKVLRHTAEWIGTFFEQKGLKRFPVGHLKGGEFLIGFNGPKSRYKNMLDLFCLKTEEYVVEGMEIYISGAVVDTSFSTDIGHMVDYLVQQRSFRLEEKNMGEHDDQLSHDYIESQVMHALKNRLLSMMFQPVEVRNERFFDISVKLIDETGRFLHQKNYMPVINRMGLSYEYDLIVCQAAIDLLKAHAGVALSIEISPASIRRYSFLETLKDYSGSDSGLFSRLLLVVGEKEYYGNIKRYNDTLQTYRNTGIRIVIDNLGSQQTSLLYLKDLDIDMIRFDNRFAKQLRRENYRALISGLHSAAKALGVKTWLRMIADDESYTVARAIGIDALQGNFIGIIGTAEIITNSEEKQ